jgi:hypothetical protein
MRSIFRFGAIHRRRQRSSSALLIVLAMVALLSFTLITFMIVSGNERAASFSYSQSIKADELAQGGANLVVQYLREEIMDTNRSTATPDPSGSSALTYMPVANAYVIPERMAAGAIDPSLTNLVKISSSTVPFYINTTIPLAAPSNTGHASINGRLLTQPRWNRPQLIDSGAVSKLTLPDWIVITRSGTTNVWNSALADQTSTNAGIGRVAFAVYDVGGLLDVTAAGYPTSLLLSGAGSACIQEKGSLPFADLTQIPGITSSSMANTFVLWRNLTSASSVNNYTNYIYNYGATNGFRKVAAGDQTLVSRQDLIQYAQENPTAISTNALPYLTTFTRELNSPSYSPATPSGSSVDYASLAKTSSATNVNFAAMRDYAGQPLKRFPLSRIGLLSNPSANATSILTYFGLQLDADGYSWDYEDADPVTSGIMTLGAVAAAGREPNFFELLQAAILQGSLGLSTYQDPAYTVFQGSSYFDASITRQIFAIGANIIDQYEAASMPTVINIVGDPTKTPVAGMENLPYVTQMVLTIYRPTLTEGNDTYRDNIQVNLSFDVWNPHQNASTLPATAPSKFRIVATDGALRIMAYNLFTAGTQTGAIYTSSPAVDYGAAYASSTSGTPYQIQFQDQTTFSEPTLLTTANSANFNPSSPQFPNGSNTSFSGILMGQVSAPDTSITPTNPAATETIDHIEILPQAVAPSGYGYATYSITLAAQFLDSKGNWQTYQKFPYGFPLNPSNGNLGPVLSTPGQGTPTWFVTLDPVNHPSACYARVDPRGSRWAMAGNAQAYPSWYPTNSAPPVSVRPTANASVAGDNTTGGGLCGPNLNSPNFWPSGDKSVLTSGMSYIGMISDNDPSTQANASTTRYAGYSDLDNIVRHADGNAAEGVFPMVSGDTIYRPLILNRPFHSVAELGNAYRDIPWKTLDFSWGASADAALLDVFTANDDVETTPSSALSIVAGKVDLNTRRPEVLATLLSKAGARQDGTENLSATEALLIAQNVVAASQAKPFLTKADLVSNFAAAQQTTYNLTTSSSYPAYSPVKAEREAMIRALADVGQTRTWNLLIDVVAQAGKYPPSATGLDQFNVEGERRYWLHIAIDRYTGKVLGSYMEPVYE